MSGPWLHFVVLRHEGVDPPHYDVMMETAPGSALATWRSPVWPLTEGVDLLRLADHRREYLEYEGPVSGERGQVRRVAAGRCRISISRPSDPARWLLTLDLPDSPARHLTLEERGEGVWRAWAGMH